MAEIILDGVEGGEQFGVLRFLAQGFQRIDGHHAVQDAFGDARFEFVEAGNLLVQRARADDAHHVRQVNAHVRGALFFIREAEDGQAGRGFLGGPHRFHCCELGFLFFGSDKAGLIAHDDHRERGGQTEGSGDAEGATGEFDIAVLQQIPGADAEHEHRAGDITGTERMHELGLRHHVEDDFGEAGHLHAHGHRVEGRADRILHPAVGDQDEQGGEVGADGDQIGDDEVRPFRQPIPAEEEETDHRRFEEEGQQPFDGQRRTEDVTHVVRVIRPVGSELEFHGQAGGDAKGEVDAEELAPELGHVPVDRFSGEVVNRFHDGQQKRQAERQGNEQEVINGG